MKNDLKIFGYLFLMIALAIFSIISKDVLEQNLLKSLAIITGVKLIHSISKREVAN
jgi:hypothetical protein